MTCEHESRKSQPGSRGNYHASIILVQVLNDVSVGLLGRPETVARKRMVCGVLRSCLGLFLGHPRNTWNPLKRALARDCCQCGCSGYAYHGWVKMFIKPQRCYPNFSVFNRSGDFHALPSWLNGAED